MLYLNGFEFWRHFNWVTVYITDQQITNYRAMNNGNAFFNTEIRIMVSGTEGLYCYSLLIAPLCRREDDIGVLLFY